MLIPITRKKFEELVPLIATSEQYLYYWGKVSDLLRRVLISVVAGVVVVVLQLILGKGFGLIIAILGTIAGFYWLWSPIYWASRRNAESRKYAYSGFWQGQVLDAFITEELIGQEETVNDRGDLVIVENRERRLNLEVGDETEFSTQIQVPLRRDHRLIRPGDTAELMVMSNRPDLSRIAMVSDIYIPDYRLWVSDYPYLRRDVFIEVSRRLNRKPRGGRRRQRRDGKDVAFN
ncbi:MAG: phosphate ABC transporter permease [Cyanothece sp. SIO1E1]|nr:phosphate ABC transporter permease [Cyanothece sp. SIO1E1]